MKKIIYIFALILAVVSLSCKKPIEESRDYRDKWVGTYMFITYHHLQFYSQGFYIPESFVSIDDTTEFIGTIDKWGEDMLRIVFKPNATEPDTTSRNPVRVEIKNGIVYPKVDSMGVLTYPEWNPYGNRKFGSFSNIEINMNYSRASSRGSRIWETHKIYGIKF
ncbi:MAG: hypothetical protein J5606_06855 [Bacteroidales bacterium]|nr:hypothetical protein [Bacteroidales bacterium]